MSRPDIQSFQNTTRSVHRRWVVGMVVNDYADVEPFLYPLSLQVFSDSFLPLQQLPNEVCVELIMESWVFLLVLQSFDVLSERVQAVIYSCRWTQPVNARKPPDPGASTNPRTGSFGRMSVLL